MYECKQILQRSRRKNRTRLTAACPAQLLSVLVSVCVTCVVVPLLLSYSSPAFGYIFSCISQRYKVTAIIFSNNLLLNLHHHTRGWGVLLLLKIVGSLLKKK